MTPHMMHKAMALVCLLIAIAGCDETSNTTPESDASADVAVDTGQPDASMDTTPEPAWEPPNVEGVSAVLEDMNPDPDIVEVELRAEKTQVTLSEDIVLDMLTYNGHFPGPLLQAKVGDTVIVHFTNMMDEQTTVHWHGLRISDQMDGTPRVQAPVAGAGGTFTYRFVVPEAGTFWYHPHIRSHEQVERGLYGPLVVHEPADDTPYDAERMVVLDNMLLTQDDQGQIDFASFNVQQHMIAMHGRGGNLLLTNGGFSDEAGASAEQGQVERWRLVNTTNASTFNFSLENARFRVIGTDGGRLAQPYITDRLNVAVGQRYELEVYYDTPGDAVLTAHILALDDNNNVVEVPYAMFTTQVAETGAPPAVPFLVPEQPERPERSVDREVEIRLSVTQTSSGEIRWQMNGLTAPMEPLFTFAEGETVKISIINEAGPEHPFHLHGQFFEIIDDGRPETTQPGLKDTVLVPGASTVEIIAYFDNPGQWMAHCHILEHAELGMMSEVYVLPE